MHPFVAVVVVVAVAAVVFLVVKNRDRIAKEVQREKADADAMVDKAKSVADSIRK